MEKTKTVQHLKNSHEEFYKQQLELLHIKI